MKLSEKQQKFSVNVARLISFLDSQKIGVTFGDAYRSEELASIYAKQGKGIANSLHTLRLAVDLNLFKDGEYLTEGDVYSIAGEFWESLSTDGCHCAWGGRFGDLNHFSVEHNGVK